MWNEHLFYAAKRKKKSENIYTTKSLIRKYLKD